MNPNWFKQQEIMAKMAPFMSSLAPQAAPVQQAPAPEEKKAEKAEKTPAPAADVFSCLLKAEIEAVLSC
jgi:hypothetical protein